MTSCNVISILTKKENYKMDVYHDFILDKESISNVKNNVKVFDINIYPEQMKEDISVLEYILCNIYSGKDFLKKRGIVVSDKLNAAKLKIDAVSFMNKVDFFNLLCSVLSEVEDDHLVFTLPYFEQTHHFCMHNTVYFADFVLQKNGDKYVVVASNDSSIKCGDIIEAEEDCLYATVGSQLLYGVFSKKDIQTTTCICNGKEIKINVFSMPVKKISSDIWSYNKYQDIDIVAIHRFTSFNEVEEQEMINLISLGSKLKESKKIILDLRGNYGGNSQYVQRFIENLNGSAVLNLNYAKLNTQGSRLAEISLYANDLLNYEYIKKEILSDPISRWQCSEIQPIQEAQYKKELILLTDRRTASSAEIMIKCVKDNIPQSIVIGENTSGTLNTGDIRYFYLPNSMIFLNIPTAIFAGIFDEGTGFIPDYWSKDDAMQSAINYLTDK